jgi:hypothetical protein
MGVVAVLSKTPAAHGTVAGVVAELLMTTPLSSTPNVFVPSVEPLGCPSAQYLPFAVAELARFVALNV